MNMKLFLCISVFVLRIASAHGYIETYPPLVSSENVSDPLYLGLIMSFGEAFNTSGTVPGVQVALDLINDDPKMLPGYTLHYMLTDSQCDQTVALEAFFDQILPEHDPTKIALMGAGCSVATEPTAQISHFYNINQISCASSSTELADRARFRAYFQMLPTDVDLAAGFAATAVEYKWKNISIIQQNENLFIYTVDRVQELLSNANISSTLQSFESSEGVLSLRDTLVSLKGARIYYLAMYSSNARVVLCEAYMAGKVYPRYVYLTYAWYTDQWWVPAEDNNIPCTREQLESVLEYTLAFTQCPVTRNTSRITDEGISHMEYEERYRRRLQEQSYSYIVNAEHCFDGIWALAYALNRTISAMMEGLNGSNSGPLGLDDFTYNSSAVRQLLFNYLSETDFEGITGPVSFNEDGIRTVSRLRVLQYRKINGSLALAEIASIMGNTLNSEFVYQEGEDEQTVWPGGVPYDGVPDQVTISVHVAVTSIYSVLIVAGMAFAVACLIFTIAFRKKKMIRLSSPNLNYFIITGAVAMYASVLFYIIPVLSEEAATVTCNVGPRLFTLGYSICFGTILAKMWRVYYIFTNPSPTKKGGIKDWIVMSLVGAIVLLDTIPVLVLTAYEGGRTKAVLVQHVENPSDEEGELGYITEYSTYVCDSVERSIWLGVVYGYIAVLQIAALFLAFGTRKVTIKGLDDSKYIAAIIYVTSIMLLVIIAVSIAASKFINTHAILLATCILVSTTTILLLVFVPKAIELYRDPKGEMVFEPSASSTTTPRFSVTGLDSNNTAGDISKVLALELLGSDKERIEALTKHVQVLYKQLSETQRNCTCSAIQRNKNHSTDETVDTNA